MPRWRPLLMVTMPMPTDSALAMAISIALGATTRPIPASQSIVAVDGLSRTIRQSGLGLISPTE